MKYDVLLFDADDTLLDFKKSERITFDIVLNKHGLIGEPVQLDQLIESYKSINSLLWSQEAQGLVTKDFLKIERFKQFLETNNLFADPALLSEDYLETLPSQVFLTEGAFELVSGLHGKIPIVIITNGVGNVQYKRFSQSGLNPFIEMMIISEECGFSKPDKRIFDYTFNRLREKLKKNPSESKFLMIGDKLETDILGAQNCEIDSCWYNPDKIINSTTIAPTFEIQSLSELLNYL